MPAMGDDAAEVRAHVEKTLTEATRALATKQEWAERVRRNWGWPEAQRTEKYNAD